MSDKPFNPDDVLVDLSGIPLESEYNRRAVFIGLGVGGLFAVLIALVVFVSTHRVTEYDHAKAACTSWRSVVEEVTAGSQPQPGDMDQMIAEAKKAAVADPRYTKLWSDMREYRLFISTGVSTNLNYVSNDCSDI